jgi:hypothetical protein
MDISKLLEYATDRQKEILLAIESEGSERKAGIKLGISKSTVHSAKKAIEQKAALMGYSPKHDLVHPVPDGFRLKGSSTMYDMATGEAKIQWVKSTIDLQRQSEMLQEFTAAFLEDIPVFDNIEFNGNDLDLDTDIIPWFQIGDGHVGMLAASYEVGHNFDLKIAERELVKAMTLIIDRSPDCDRCVIQDLGDMTHYQDFTAKSESGHDFDYDSRYPKMIETVARIMRSIVDKALSKFKYVDVIINQGNHSRSNDVWMRIFLKHVYSNNNRLHILDNSSVFIPYRMGNTFVMCHHSDKCKPNRLVDVMATDFSSDWGESKFRYIDIGHIHNRQVTKEFSGVTVEIWNQLAPGDKYAHDGGWRSRSCLSVVLRSKTYGEVGRITIPVEEVKDIINNAIPGTELTNRRSVYSV